MSGIFFSRHTSFSLSKEIRNPEGRFLLLAETIDGSTFTFVTYYALNHGQAELFSSMMETLSPQFRGMVIIGGDSNVAPIRN